MYRNRSTVMAQIIPLVRGDTLVYQQDKQDYVLVVGTTDWFAWLTTASDLRLHQ